MLSIAQQLEAARINYAGFYCPPSTLVKSARENAKQTRADILTLLQNNGAQTCRQLSERFGISATTASHYMRIMIDDGSIKQVTVKGSNKRHFAAGQTGITIKGNGHVRTDCNT